MVSEAEWQRKMVVVLLMREDEKEERKSLFPTKVYTKDKF